MIVRKKAIWRAVFSNISLINPFVSRISSFDNKERKVTWLFVKKAIWRAVFSNISLINPFVSRLRNSIFLNSYSIYKDQAKTRIIILNIISILAVSFILSIPIYFIAHNGFGKGTTESIEIALSALAPGTLIQLITKKIIKDADIYNENDFFVDPISNAAISKYIGRLSRSRVLLIHVSELDRVNDEINNPALTGYIVESLALGYVSKNVNLIFETDESTSISISKKREKSVSGEKERRNLLDKPSKLFNKIIEIRSYNAKTLSDHFGLKGNQKVFFEEFFKALGDKKLKGIKSWRLADEHYKLFKKANKELGLSDDFFEGKKVNKGFKDSYKLYVYTKYLDKWREEEAIETFDDIKNEVNLVFGKEGIKKDLHLAHIPFYASNPHLYTTGIYYPQVMKTAEYQKYFIETLAKDSQTISIWKNAVLLYTVYYLSADQISELPKMNFDGLLTVTHKYRNADQFKRDILFKKLKQNEKIEIINSIKSSATLLKNKWLSSSVDELIPDMHPDVLTLLIKNEFVAPYDAINNTNLSLKNIKDFGAPYSNLFIEEINKPIHKEARKTFWRKNYKIKSSKKIVIK